MQYVTISVYNSYNFFVLRNGFEEQFEFKLSTDCHLVYQI